MAAGYFLLLAQKKVTKENGTLGSAPLAQRAVRCGRTGSADRPSMACSRIGAIPRAARALRGFSVRPSPLLRGDPRACPHPSPLPQAGEGTRCASREARAASAAGTAALCPARTPLGRGEQVQEIARRGARRMRARSTRAQGRAPGEPRSLLAQSARMDARVTADARVSFSWLLLFGQAKRSNRRPWMADDPHTDVSRSSRQRRRPKPKNQDQNGFRPSPE